MIFLQNKNFLNILISAIIFSLAHTPNWGYRIFAFVMGMLLAYTFIIYEER
ncbi:CPBP family intramembrane metalloprotease [Clostridium gasigenes]|uniref:CPBP family glutamic-type intramembrane protease n=1 Tax=Clostridium gasigenes TaxID=94869 RepID=UPI00143869A4|nr:CPBP family intramembrane metalloprotease [Clostridium gasigenes]QSW21458.1 CPBP family intramembrane metalloprotease [Clostridium gasigenes]